MDLKENKNHRQNTSLSLMPKVVSMRNTSKTNFCFREETKVPRKKEYILKINKVEKCIFFK